MVREPLDGHIPPVDPDDAFDDTYVDPLAVERATLLVLEHDDLERMPRCHAALRTDSDVELRRTHEPDHVVAASEVGVAVGDAAHAALRILAELGQCREVGVETRTVDAEAGLGVAARASTNG